MDSPRASSHLLRDLSARGVLTPVQVLTLERLLRARLPWRSWSERLLLALGAALMLAGVIFFFAYNWDQMPAWQKLGVVEITLAGCAATAAWRGLDDFAGQIALSSACVLVGVFLAVFGQIYQTGAESFELFMGWAALIFPWVLLGRFPALWIFWLALINAALGTAWEHVNLWRLIGFQQFYDLAVLIGVINGLALAAREIGAARGQEWLRESWLRPALMLATFAALTIANVVMIADSFSKNWTPFPPALLLIAAALGYHMYRNRLPSLSSLAVIALSLCIVLVTLLGRLLFEGGSDAGTMLFFAMFVLAIFGGALAWLRRISATFSAR